MIHSALKEVAVGIALIGAVGAVNATTYDFGLLNTTAGAANIQIGPSANYLPVAFDDTFKFTAGALPGVLGSLVGLDGSQDMEFAFRFGFGATPTWGNWSNSVTVQSDISGSFSYSANVGGLTAGQIYWFELAGTATEASYSVTLAPVPELDSYAMLMAGLGLMGAIARRRKISAAV